MSGPFTEEKMSLILILPAPGRIRQAKPDGLWTKHNARATH